MAEQEKVTPTEEITETNKPAEEKAPHAKRAPRGKSEDGAGQKIADAEQRAADAEQRMNEVNERLLRTAAEYDNHRKRSQREQESAFNNGVSYAVQELLPVLDTLGCAATAETADEEYKKGVLMTLTKCELSLIHI